MHIGCKNLRHLKYVFLQQFKNCTGEKNRAAVLHCLHGFKSDSNEFENGTHQRLQCCWFYSNARTITQLNSHQVGDRFLVNKLLLLLLLPLFRFVVPDLFFYRIVAVWAHYRYLTSFIYFYVNKVCFSHHLNAHTQLHVLTKQ